MEAEEILKYYGDLSRFELLQLFHMQKDSVVADISIFMTVLFGYIAAAYFVGARLLKSQAIAISILYSVFALIVLGSIWSSLLAMSSTQFALMGEFLGINFILLVTLSACWLYSLWFMIQIRRKGST